MMFLNLVSFFESYRVFSYSFTTAIRSQIFQLIALESLPTNLSEEEMRVLNDLHEQTKQVCYLSNSLNLD